MIFDFSWKTTAN